MHPNKDAIDEARAKDAAYLDGTPLPEPVTEIDPLMLLPDWLNRNLTEEQRDTAWQAYCDALGLTVRAPARDMKGENLPVVNHPVVNQKVLVVDEPRPDLRQISKQEADHKRITKMKVGLQKKAARASGADKAMPLTGKDALRAIKGE